MPGFFLRTAISAMGLWIAGFLIPSMQFSGTAVLVTSAFLLGIVNAIVRPLFVVLTFPITVLTLGLFLLVVNAAMLGLVAWLLAGFQLGGFWDAIFGSAVVSMTGWVASWFIGSKGSVEVMTIENSREVREVRDVN